MSELAVAKVRIPMHMVTKALFRSVAFDCPESRLIVSVIAQAIDDTNNAKEELDRQSARYFLDDTDRLKWFCDLVGLNHEYVLEVSKKAGYTPATVRRVHRCDGSGK